MILNKEQLSKLTLDEVKGYKHLVLNIEHTIYDYISEPLKYAIEIINFISKMQRVNKTYEQLKIDKSIDLSILYEAIQVIMNGKSFNENQIERFLDVLKINSDFEKCFIELVDICNYLPSDVELALYGFNSEDVIKDNANYYGHFVDEVFDYQYKALKKEISVIEFITKTRELYKKLPRGEKLKLKLSA